MIVTVNSPKTEQGPSRLMNCPLPGDSLLVLPTAAAYNVQLLLVAVVAGWSLARLASVVVSPVLFT